MEAAELATYDEMMAVDAWYWATEIGLRLQSGPFTLAGHEYQIEPMQIDGRDRCAMKAAQMGWTEGQVIRNLHGMIYGRYPAGVLYLFPTADDVADFSKARFNPLIRDNPSIAAHVRSTDSAAIKRVGTGFLYLRGARITQTIQGVKKDSSKLRSIPVDCVVCDERDLMDDAAIEMATERMAHSYVQEYTDLSTPTIPDYGIAKRYDDSDQRVWMIRCRHCNHETCLETEFPDCLGIRADGSVFRKCSKCGKEIYPRDGRWVARQPGRDRIGHWISQLNSIYVDPGDILRAYEFPPNGNLQEVYNSKLGMPYIAAEDRLTIRDVLACCGNYPMYTRHTGPCAMGVDVGKVLHAVIGVRVSEDQYSIVRTERLSSFEDLHDLAARFNVTNAVIDALPEIHKVRDFRAAEPYEVFLCQYNEHQATGPKWNLDTGIVQANRTEVCDQTHALITTAGRCEIPRRCDEVDEYATEMCNIAKVLEEDQETGSRLYRYRKLGADHYRHATNYFLMAASRCNIAAGAGGRRFRPRQEYAENDFSL
ncbi:MAG: hypothetical protein AVO39_10290 [delta proteobacterium MLS_D]|nr:MAG: hypothetical protein AVO39_10290 [delta proteobacterium MLS_D]